MLEQYWKAEAPEAAGVRILERHAGWVAVLKPEGVASERDGMGALLAKELGLPAEEIYPVHRLDREVGGVMVYALRAETAADLSRAAAENRIRKTYLALAQGVPAETSGTWEDLLFHDRGRNKTYVVKRERKGVRFAALDYQIIRTFGPEDPENPTDKTLSLLEMTLRTGRTHQIRVQCASRGMPLLGDRKYGGERWNHLALLAWKLSFPDPETGEERTFKAC